MRETQKRRREREKRKGYLRSLRREWKVSAIGARVGASIPSRFEKTTVAGIGVAGGSGHG